MSAKLQLVSMEQCPKIPGVLHSLHTERFLKLQQPKIQNPNYVTTIAQTISLVTFSTSFKRTLL